MYRARLSLGAFLLIAVGIVLAGCGGGELRVVVSSTGWLYVPLDEQGQYGSAGATDIYALSPDGSTVKRLTATQGVKENWVNVSPDGQQLLYVSVAPQSDPAQTAPYKLILSDAEGNSTKTLIESGELLVSPSFSPSGEYIAYATMHKTDASKYSIYVYDLQTSQSRELVTEIALPGMGAEIAWAPTSDALALVEYKPEKDEQGVETARSALVHLTLDGKKETLVSGMIQAKGVTQKAVTASEGMVSFAFATWSPDGRSLVFTGFEYQASSKSSQSAGQLMGGVYQLNLKDRSVRRLYLVPVKETADNASLYPTFSPAGSYLAFTTMSYEKTSTPFMNSTMHDEDKPTGHLYVFDFAQNKIVKELDAVDPWVAPFWGDEHRLGYASASGFGGAPLGAKGPGAGAESGNIESEEHSESRFLWLEDLQTGQRINLSERLQSMIVQEDLSHRISQLELETKARKMAQDELAQKIGSQLAELGTKAKQIDDTNKAVADLKSQLDAKVQEIQSLKNDLEGAKSEAASVRSMTDEMKGKLKAETDSRQTQYAGIYIVMMILLAALGVWIWLRTRTS